MKRFVLLSILAASALIAADTVPTRIPPLPSPKSKIEQARILREAAAILESEARKGTEELRLSISNRIHGIEFSTDKSSVKVATIQFSEWNGDLLVTVTFKVSDK